MKEIKEFMKRVGVIT